MMSNLILGYDFGVFIFLESELTYAVLRLYLLDIL